MEKPDFAKQPVLEDFAIFLTFLHTKQEVPATLQQGHLKQKDLFQLNQELHYHADWVTEKSMQPAYPELEFFYEVALAAGIVNLRARDKDSVLQVEEEKWYRYQQLSAKDQYFFLLETAWRYLNWEKITGSPLIYFHQVMRDFIKFLASHPADTTINVKHNEKDRSLNAGLFCFDLYNKVAQIFSFLGFCTLEPDNTLTKKPDKYTAPFKSITTTLLGALLAPVLAQEFPFYSANILTQKRLSEDNMRDFALYRKEAEMGKLIEASSKLNNTGNQQNSFLNEIAAKIKLGTPPETFYTDSQVYQPGNYVLNSSYY